MTTKAQRINEAEYVATILHYIWTWIVTLSIRQE